VGKMTVRNTAALLLAVLGAPGCYRYVPTDFLTVPVGQDVRLVVIPDQIDDLAEIRTQDDAIPVVAGTVLGRDGQDLLVLVPIARRQEGFQTRVLSQSIRVPATAIVRAELKLLDKGKTVGAMALGLAGLAGLVFAGLEVRGGETPQPDDDPPELRLTIFSLPIG